MRNTKNITSLAKACIACLLAGTVFLLAACGNNTGGSSAPADSATAGLGATAEKQPGGDLFIAMPANIGSLDPLQATDEDLVNLLTLIYEPAVRIDETGKPQPCLAESWEADESGTVYTFKLRQNASFSDGTPLKAGDVVYSANKVRELTPAPTPTLPEGTDDPEPASSPAPTESPDAASTEPAQDAQANRYAQYNSVVSNVEAVDESTVKVTMSKPGLEALYFMTFPVMNEGQRAEGNTVGTGPYKMESFDPSNEMVLTINDAWWGVAPNIPKIVAKPMTGNTAKLDAVSTSVLDFATTDVLYAGKYKKASQTQVIDYMTNYYDCLVPNLGSNTLGITEVRQALSYAIDRREIISTVLLNHAVPANLPIAPNFYAYDSKYKQDDDLKVARELLHNAGYKTSMEDAEGSPLVFSLIVPDDRETPYRVEAAKAIAKQLKEVGITVNVEPLSQEDYVNRLQTRNFDLAFCSFYMDEDPDIAFLFDPGGSGNFGGVNSTEISNAISAARSAFREEDVQKSYSELQRQLTERVPQIGLYFRMNSAVCNDLLKDIKGMRQGQVFSHINEWYYQKS